MIRSIYFTFLLTFFVNEFASADLWENAVQSEFARITQLHGAYDDAISGKTHTGIDIGVKEEDGSSRCGLDNIYPVRAGEVEAVYEEGVWPGDTLGNAIVVDHLDGSYSLYAHMTDKSDLQEGETVTVDDVLGTVNSTGSGADGCHLHLELRDFPDPYYVNPNESCVQGTYRCGDVREKAYFLNHWDDLIEPRIGRFDVVQLPDGFESSELVEGWDVSGNGYSTAFMDAYKQAYEDLNSREYDATLQGHPGNPGDPYNNMGINNVGGGEHVHCWSAPGENSDCTDGVWIQDLRRTKLPFQLWPDGHSALILNPQETPPRAYHLREGFWVFYTKHDGFRNLGAPTSNERQETITVDGDPVSGTIQRFRKGALFYNDAGFDRTSPTDDGITVLDSENNSVQANQRWHWEGRFDEAIDLHQNGDYICTTPCAGIYRVDGWRYTTTVSNYVILGISTVENSSVRSVFRRLIPIEAAKASDVYGDATVNDEQNFSYTALSAGGSVVLDVTPDKDGDRLPDSYEDKNGLDKANPADAGTDMDLDGLNALEEYRSGTNANDWDSDGDGIKDGLDTAPMVANNFCSGENAHIPDQIITNKTVCAAEASINVESGVQVDDFGDLTLMSPRISVAGSFDVSGRLSVQSRNPGLSESFSDDFEDNSIDSSLWTQEGNTVSEEQGELRVDVTVQDDGGRVWTREIPIDPTKPVRIARQVRVFAANDKFNGRLKIVPVGAEEKQFGVSYADYDYTGNDECVTYGFSIYRNGKSPHKCATHGSDMSELIKPLWDEWFQEEVVYNPATGQVSYLVNGSSKIVYDVGSLPEGVNSIKIGVNVWGWYTGHFQYMDWFRVEQ